MRHLLCTLVLVAGSSTLVSAQDVGPGDAERIRSALSAAPASVAAHATVADHDGRVLRRGTSDWVCLPDMEDVPNDTPMCLDATWRERIDAWQNRRAPHLTAVGISYMLRGDLPVSNVDPFAQAPTDDNQWIQKGPPHVMVAVPDPALLAALSTDPDNGGPWVMWKGTPYAHIMIPVPPSP